MVLYISEFLSGFLVASITGFVFLCLHLQYKKKRFVVPLDCNHEVIDGYNLHASYISNKIM